MQLMKTPLTFEELFFLRYQQFKKVF
jgi:hypothetical protein